MTQRQFREAQLPHPCTQAHGHTTSDSGDVNKLRQCPQTRAHSLRSAASFAARVMVWVPANVNQSSDRIASTDQHSTSMATK